jgi:hypothetical protein
VAVVVAFSVRLHGHGEAARERVAREDQALEVLRRVAEAERRHRDRHGRHASLDDLVRGGVLDAALLAGGPDDVHVASPGYRIDVLLPTARIEPEVVAIARPGEAAPDPELCREHFAAVARPTEPGRSGYRSWYLDERGDLFLNEGVLDKAGLRLNDLPRYLVRRSEIAGSSSPMLWQQVSTLYVN